MAHSPSGASTFPQPTHSQDALPLDQWITGRHWERHRVPKTERTAVPERLRSHVDRLRDSLFPVEGDPWGTVRDALQGLPDPEISNGSQAKT